MTPREELERAARALVDKIALVDVALKSIYESAFIHGVKYDGPMWVEEIDALKAALTPAAPSAPLDDFETQHTCTTRWTVMCDGSGLEDHDCGEDSCCCADPESDRDECVGCPACCEVCRNMEGTR